MRLLSMTSMARAVLVATSSAVWVGLGVQGGVSAVAPGAQVQWKQSLEVPGLWLTLTGAALTEAQLVVAATGRTPPGPEIREVSLWLWSVGSGGTLRHRTEIPKPKSDAVGNPVEGKLARSRDVLALHDGTILLVADFGAGRPWLAHVGRSEGQDVRWRELDLGLAQASVYRAFSTQDGAIALLGQANGDFLAAKVDVAGAAKWKVVIDGGSTDVWLDGIPTPDGGFIAVGTSGESDISDTGSPLIRISQFDGDGTVVREESFPGNSPRITPAAGGGYAIVYDADASLRLDVRAKAFRADLTESWTAPVLAVDNQPSGFSIAPTSDGGFIVACTKNAHVHLTRLDAQGKRVWDLEDASLLAGIEYRLLPSTTGLFLVHAAYSVEDNDLTGRFVSVKKFEE